MNEITKNSILVGVCFILVVSTFLGSVKADNPLHYENQYGVLEVWPPTSNNIIRQKQYYAVKSYLPSQNIDIAFRFNDSLSYGELYVFDGNGSTGFSKVNFDHVEYNDYHWYVKQNVYLETNETVFGYWMYDIPLGSSGKWDLFMKRSSDTLQEALSSGFYVHLDPWWNSSWVNMRVGNITNYENDASVFINLTYDSDMNNNFTDVRFVNESNTTELFHWFETVVNGSYAHVWVNISDSDDFINMYYNNSAITSFSIANNPYKTFIDFMNVSNISRFWRSGGAAGDINITSINDMVNINQDSKITAAVVIINLTGGMTDYVTDINFMCHNLSDHPVANDNIFWSVRGNAGPISYVSLQRNSNLDATYLYYDSGPVLSDLIYNGYLVDTEYVSRFIVNDSSDMCYGYQYNVMYGLLGSTIKRIKTAVEDLENKYYVWDGTGATGEFNFSVNYVKLYLNTTANISFGPQQNYTPPCGLSYSNENPTNGSYDNSIWLNLSVLVTNDGPCVGSYVNMSMWVGSTFYFQNTTSITNETVYLNNTNITYNGLFRCWVNGSSAGNQTGMWFEFYSVNVTLIDIYNELLQKIEEGDNVEISFLGISIINVIGLLLIAFLYVVMIWKEDVTSVISAMFGTVVSLAVGVAWLQYSVNSISWWIGIICFLSSIAFAMLIIYYSVSFARLKQKKQRGYS